MNLNEEAEPNLNEEERKWKKGNRDLKTKGRYKRHKGRYDRKT